MTRNQLKRLRQQKRLTQRQVASRLGCTRSHYSNLENGYRRISSTTEKRITKALRG